MIPVDTVSYMLTYPVEHASLLSGYPVRVLMSAYKAWSGDDGWPAHSYDRIEELCEYMEWTGNFMNVARGCDEYSRFENLFDNVLRFRNMYLRFRKPRIPGLIAETFREWAQIVEQQNAELMREISVASQRVQRQPCLSYWGPGVHCRCRRYQLDFAEDGSVALI